jgi:hypothetical protein
MSRQHPVGSWTEGLAEGRTTGPIAEPASVDLRAGRPPGRASGEALRQADNDPTVLDHAADTLNRQQ